MSSEGLGPARKECTEVAERICSPQARSEGDMYRQVESKAKEKLAKAF